MQKNNLDNCPACNGNGEVKIIKNIAQIVPYHLGKEMMEKCSFCKIHNNEKEKILTNISGTLN